MISTSAMAALEAAGMDYLLGVRERSRREAGIGLAPNSTGHSA